MNQNLTRGNACGASVCVLLITLGVMPIGTVRAQREYTEIAGVGQSLYTIAIPKLWGGSGKAALTAQKVLTNDLKLIGYFKVLDPRGFLANLKRERTGFVPKNWASVGAQAVVKGQLSRGGGGYTIDWYLYDVGKGAVPVLQKRYSGRRIRMLAHKFGDDIVAYYTKRKGIFTTKIAFAASNRRNRSSQIYVVDFDGYGPRRISRTGKQNILPAIAPSGAVVYTSMMWRNPDLYLAGGGRAKRISRRPGLNAGASFSPKGGQIALTMTKDGNSEIYIITTSGSIVRRVTKHPAIDASPTWSPDGSRLAFVSNRGGSPQVYVVSARGGSPRRVTFSGKYNQEPSWNPDPNKPLIAFTGRDEAGRYDIFTVNVQSGEVKRLTQGQGSNKSPSWAPNGEMLVFASSRGGLWLMNQDGLNQNQIYRGAAGTPDWSR